MLFSNGANGSPQPSPPEPVNEHPLHELFLSAGVSQSRSPATKQFATQNVVLVIRVIF